MRSDVLLLPDVPGAVATNAGSINNLGQIAGNYGGTDWLTRSRGFVYAGGAFSFLDYPGAVATFLPQVNAAGQAAGRWVDAAGRNHGYLYAGGTFRPYDVPGSTGTSGFGINDTGQVVGWYQDAAGFHGYLTTFAAVSAVPEPGTLALLAAGVGVLGGVGWRRRRRRA